MEFFDGYSFQDEADRIRFLEYAYFEQQKQINELKNNIELYRIEFGKLILDYQLEGWEEEFPELFKEKVSG